MVDIQTRPFSKNYRYVGAYLLSEVIRYTLLTLVWQWPHQPVCNGSWHRIVVLRYTWVYEEAATGFLMVELGSRETWEFG